MKEREIRGPLGQAGSWARAANAGEQCPSDASGIVARGGFSELALAAQPETALEANARGELARVWASCGAFEWVAFGYLAFASLMIFAFSKNLARTNVAQPWKLIGAQAIVATLILILCSVTGRAEIRARQEGVTRATRFWHFWRHWYPHLFFLFCFEELAYLVHLLNPTWQDAKLIAFDHWMFGVHPSVWLEQFASPLLNDFIQLAYLTYFVYLVVLGGLLYYRKEWDAYWSVMTYSAVGYAIGYVIAMLFPVQSPWFAMAGMWHGDLHGGPFNPPINFIQHYGPVR